MLKVAPVAQRGERLLGVEDAGRPLAEVLEGQRGPVTVETPFLDAPPRRIVELRPFAAAATDGEDPVLRGLATDRLPRDGLGAAR